MNYNGNPNVLCSNTVSEPAPCSEPGQDRNILSKRDAYLLTNLLITSSSDNESMLQRALTTIGNKAAFTQNQVCAACELCSSSAELKLSRTQKAAACNNQLPMVCYFHRPHHSVIIELKTKSLRLLQT